MGKFFFKPEERSGQFVIFTGSRAHHLTNVLRFKKGQEQILCDGNDTDYLSVMDSAIHKPYAITFKILNSSPSKTEPSYPITLFQGLPKGDKMDWIIEKCIEAGVYRIVPVLTNRSVVKIKDALKMKDRYMRIAESAASQSMRGVIPDISAPLHFADILKDMNSDLCLVAFEKERSKSINSALYNKAPCPINLWIGPEGGFEDYEVKALTDIGATTIGLGPRILRSETAGLYALAQISCMWSGVIHDIF